MPTLVKLLMGHVSPETAFVVADYPYGSQLRCTKRIWLEYKRGHGVRMVYQTTNPKRGNVWNKPHADTYCDLGAALYLDELGHVQCAGLSAYSSGVEAAAWRDTYGAGVPAGEATERLTLLVAGKVAFDRLRAEGLSMPEAVAKSRIEAVKAVRAAQATATAEAGGQA